MFERFPTTNIFFWDTDIFLEESVSTFVELYLYSTNSINHFRSELFRPLT